MAIINMGRAFQKLKYLFKVCEFEVVDDKPLWHKIAQG